MATTVGQHSVAAFTSPVNGTTPIDANTVRGNDNTVRVAYVDHDADPGIHVQSSTLASRPAAGTAGRKWITSDYPQKLWYDDGTDWHEVGGDAITVYCKATETIAKGDIVKVTGWNTGQSVAEIAKVSSASDVAFGIAESAIANGSLGYVVNTGIITDVATNSFSIGNILYPNTSGGLTATKPTSGTYQTVAYVLRAHASNGVLYVEFSASRIVEASANTASTVVQRDASGDFSAGTITATAVNTTTIDLTNLEVTNIKAKDGTASATIADGTGVMTIGSSVLTTTDINGGTIDGTTIGGASAATGTFTTATATTGNITTVNATTVDTTNIEVTNVKAKDGTASATIADSTGKITITAAPILSALTASQAVFTDASKGLVSNAITGTGNVVMSASPTLTGTITAAGLSMSGTLTLGSDVALSRGAADRLDLASGDSLNVVSGTYKIGATDVLSSTTLGSGVTASSLTSVGTLSSLTVSGVTTLSAGTASAPALTTSGDTNNGLFFPAADVTAITTAGTERLRVDASGNLGLGVTPSAWGSAYKALDFGYAQVAVENQTVGQALFACNIYATGTGTSPVFKRRAGAPSSLYLLDANIHKWYSAASGAADSTITSWTPAMTLDASGNLGLGVTPSAWSTASNYSALQLRNASLYFRTAAAELYINNNAFYNGTNWTYLQTSPSARYDMEGAAHKWYNAASGTAGNAITFTQAMTLDASGNLLVGKTTTTANGGVVQVSNGVTFPATQSACSDANTLDDYEEGTWTPIVVGSTSAGTGTYGTQVGRYIKIGKMVTASAYITMTNHTGTGNVTLNLPFTVVNTANYYPSVAFGLVDNLALTANNIVTGYGVLNTTRIDVYQYPTGGGGTTTVPMDTAFNIMYTITYEASS